MSKYPPTRSSQAEREAATPSRTSSATSPASATATTTAKANVPLPRIDIPKFDGKLEKWVEFKDAFETLIHAHTGLSDVEKLTYLRLSLIGAAQRTIASFSMSRDNYTAAWEQIVEAYDNKRALIMRHAELIVDMPTMPDDSPESIRDAIDHMQSHLRSLTALGRSEAEQRDDLCVAILNRKLGPKTRHTWEQTLTDTEMPSIHSFLKHLRIQSHRGNQFETTPNRSEPHSNWSRTHENAKPAERRPERRPEPRRYPARKSAPPPRNANRQTFATTTTNTGRKSPSSPNRDNWETVPRKSNNGRKSPPPSPRANRRQQSTKPAETNCRICKNGAHHAYQCHVFLGMPTYERVQAAQNANLCLNCLRSDHPTNDCKSGRCRVCNHRHNSKLHQESASRSESPI
ncbi:hypothetical protein WH47_04092 [Habropoda laboriosa]|uniref:CCHC-type domain-containing protein n=2 Tax=Habropoda laboriosa TaxID=597456 RepID=A0A0L7QXW2_9HYME|nr:hypothetical protein WH47_04092 [Habropoda laboriosa]